MQLDRLASGPAPEVSGTAWSPSGVWDEDVFSYVATPMPESPRRRARPLQWVGFAVLVLGVFGQGERCKVDARFISPSATLNTYWEALRANDADTAEECVVEGSDDVPFPGMLWFLPPSTSIRLDDFRSLPVTGGRIMVTYSVYYRPEGVSAEQSFRFGNELVRTRGEWRIARPLGEASMPEWSPVSRPVDI